MTEICSRNDLERRRFLSFKTLAKIGLATLISYELFCMHGGNSYAPKENEIIPVPAVSEDFVQDCKEVEDFTVSSWNVESRLNSSFVDWHGSSQTILEKIKDINSGVMFVIDSGDKSIDDFPGISDELKEAGYQYIIETPKGDRPERAGYTILLSKIPVEDIQKIELSYDSHIISARIEIEGNAYRLIGLHLNDESEEKRLQQVTDLEKYIAGYDQKEKLIVVGDFNATRGNDLLSWVFETKAAQKASDFILPSISKRAITMAGSQALANFENTTDLVDVNVEDIPTSTLTMRDTPMAYIPSMRLFPIDHIYVKKDISKSMTNFTVHDDGGSDHRAISAEFSICKQN